MKNIKGIIWDMDGVFYRFTQECQNQFAIAIAHSATEICTELDFHTALNLIDQSYAANTGHYGLLKQQYNIQSKDLNARYHQYMNIDFMQPNEYLVHKMKQMNVKHVLLTQGHRPWANIVLDRLGLKEIFPIENQIVFEDLDKICDGTYAKSSSELPFQLALEKLQCNAKEALMVEDTRNNLIIPFVMGITTVHVHPMDALEPSHVHHVFEETEMFADYFLAQRLELL